MKIYLAGPMRNIPEFNFPAFYDAALDLRRQGHTVFSPAERDEKRYGRGFTHGTQGDLAEIPQFDLRAALKMDVMWICEHAEAIYLLPGWERSKGATAERALGLALGLEIVEL